jgi:hypothetical protein
MLVVAWVATQIVVVHAVRPVRMFNAMSLLFVPTVPAFLALFVLTPPDLFGLPPQLAAGPTRLGALNGLMVHLLLYCTWVEAFYYIDRPVTLRILVEFVKAPRHRLTLEAIRAVYGLEQMISGRLEIMRVNGYVAERSGRYVLTGKGRLFARLIRAVRRTLGVPYYFESVPTRTGALSAGPGVTARPSRSG